MIPTSVSQLVEQIVNAVVSIVAGVYLYEYGTKVAALLRDDAFAPAWGAAGGTLGTGAGAVAGLLVLLIMFFVHKRRMRKNILKDNAKYVDSFGRIFSKLMIFDSSASSRPAIFARVQAGRRSTSRSVPESRRRKKCLFRRMDPHVRVRASPP